MACMGLGRPGGRAARQLERAIRWGHFCDLKFVAVQRFITAVRSWWRVEGSHWQHRVPALPGMRVAQGLLRVLGWSHPEWGVWCRGGSRLNVKDPSPNFGRCLHDMREAWREKQFNAWLRSTTRRDSGIAREVRVQYTERLGNNLRSLVKELDGDCAAVMTGGMTTPAACNERVRPRVCPYCLDKQVPTVDHVLWRCNRFAQFREQEAPRCPLWRRLGWGAGLAESMDLARRILPQMGRIRSEEARLRRGNRRGLEME